MVAVVGSGGHLLLLLLALLVVRRIGLWDQAAQRAVGGSTAPSDDKADKHVRGIAAHQDMHATKTHNTTHTPQNTHTHTQHTDHTPHTITNSKAHTPAATPANKDVHAHGKTRNLRCW